MILDELVLNNVGVFAGRNAIALTPPGSDKPVVLVGGLNGAGKTTILEAIRLALYGPLAEQSRRTGAYDSYLRSLIHQGTGAQQGASVELAFHAFREGTSRSYRIRRYWTQTGMTVRERVTVDCDGVVDGTLTQTWAEHVDAFLPRGIAGLFFFDGEQIESLADLDRSSQVLSSALSSLLGLELVDRLAADLAVVRRRHRADQVSDELRQQVTQARDKVTVTREAEQAAQTVVAEAQNREERAAKELSEAGAQYRLHGGELLGQRQSAEEQKDTLGHELRSIDDELRETAAGVAPLLLVRKALEALASRAQQETDAAREQVVLDVLSARDSQVMEQLRAAHAAEAAATAVDAYLSADRDRRREATQIERVTGLTDPAHAAYLARQALPQAKRSIETLLSRRVGITAQLDEAERLLAAIPDPGAVEELRLARDEARDVLLRAETERIRAEDAHRLLTNELQRAVAAYNKAMDDAAHASLAADDDRRLIDYTIRVQETLDVLKAATARRHVDRISMLVLDSLRTLMRKDSLVTEVAIDPGTLAVELRGFADQPLPAESLSVGERQMLAVALLWGLARAAGQPLPVVIDTPLGRLDSVHRQRLLGSYFPSASHQVVLLSTDTEIDTEAWQQITPYIGRSYRLEFDPSAGATTVRSGYFWEQ